MKHGHRGRSQSSASSSGHLPTSPPPLYSGVSPSLDSAPAECSASAELVDVRPVLSSLELRPGHSASASRIAHTSGLVPSFCASPVASGSPDWVSVVPPELGAALRATWGSRGHCTEATASPSGNPQVTTNAFVLSADDRFSDVPASVPSLTPQRRSGYSSVHPGVTWAVTSGTQSFRGPAFMSDSRQTLPSAWKSFAPPRMVRTYRSFTAPSRVSDVHAHSVVDGSGGFNPPSSRFDIAQSDEAAVSALQIQPPPDSSPSWLSDFSPVRVAHPTVLLGPTRPSPLGATARESPSLTGGDFDDCLSIVDRLLPGSVSV